MAKEQGTGVALKKKTVSLFFLGLLLMVVLEVAINWFIGNWGRIHPGWLT